jgi:pimeloyl-ACP methyl ester carboxylesterase
MGWGGRLPGARPARALPPLPPPLPPGRLVDVPGRGELLVRELRAGPAGGPTILLLHGWLLCADLNWFALYAAFARHGRVLAIDIRGHGRGIRSGEPFRLEAAADDAAAVLDRLGAGPAVVVGYSMGGSVALLMSHRHPASVAGLVLQSTALQWREERHEQALWRLMGGLDWALRAGLARRLTRRYLAHAARANPALGPVLPWLEAEAFRGDPSALAEAGRALGRFDARPFAPLVDVPTAVVVSERDRLVSARRQNELARAIPGADTVRADIGHDGWLAHPDRLADAMEMALRGVVGRLGARGDPFAAPLGRADPTAARALRR